MHEEAEHHGTRLSASRAPLDGPGVGAPEAARIHECLAQAEADQNRLGHREGQMPEHAHDGGHRTVTVAPHPASRHWA